MQAFNRSYGKTVLGLIAAAFSLHAHTARGGVVVVGGLSNFDCTNNTGFTENEFEIEFPSVDPTEISSYWANTPNYKGSGYGAPIASKRAASDGVAGHMSTYVDYLKTGIQTPTNFVEHFGVHFKKPTFMPASTIYKWKNNGVSFNYLLPTVTLTSSPNAQNGVTVTPVVTNNTNTPFIVQFRDGMTAPANGVQLGDLVDTNPEVQIVEAEIEPGGNGLQGALLQPGQVLGVDGEGHDRTDPIIINPAAWLLANPNAGASFDVNLNTAGDSALTTLSVFAVGAGNTRGASIANIFSAVNSTNTPEPTTALAAIAGIVVLTRRARRSGRIG